MTFLPLQKGLSVFFKGGLKANFSEQVSKSCS